MNHPYRSVFEHRAGHIRKREGMMHTRPEIANATFLSPGTIPAKAPKPAFCPEPPPSFPEKYSQHAKTI